MIASSAASLPEVNHTWHMCRSVQGRMGNSITCTTVWYLFILCSTARAMHTKLQHMGMSRLACSVYQGAVTASDPRLTPLTLPVSVSGPTLSAWSL